MAAEPNTGPRNSAKEASTPPVPPGSGMELATNCTREPAAQVTRGSWWMPKAPSTNHGDTHRHACCAMENASMTAMAPRWRTAVRNVEENCATCVLTEERQPSVRLRRPKRLLRSTRSRAERATLVTQSGNRQAASSTAIWAALKANRNRFTNMTAPTCA